MKLVCIFLMLFVSAQVHARGGMGKCHQEAKALCKDKNGHDMFKCMKENVSKLSPECQEKFAEKKEHMMEKREACKDDKEKFCKDIPQGDGRIMECMKKNMAQLSEGCKAQFSKGHDGKDAAAPTAPTPAAGTPPQ